MCFMCTSVFPECVPVHHVCSWCPQRPVEGVTLPGTGVSGGCELGAEPGPRAVCILF